MGNRYEHSQQGRCTRGFLLACDTAHGRRAGEKANIHNSDWSSYNRHRDQYKRNIGKLAQHAIVNARLRRIKVTAVVNVVNTLLALGIKYR